RVSGERWDGTRWGSLGEFSRGTRAEHGSLRNCHNLLQQTSDHTEPPNCVWNDPGLPSGCALMHGCVAHLITQVCGPPVTRVLFGPRILHRHFVEASPQIL